jgi:signal transduction histidine kinase
MSVPDGQTPGLTAPAPLVPAHRADFIRALLEQAPVALTGNAAGLLVVLFMFWTLVPPLWLAAWATLVAVLWVLRWLHWQRYRRVSDVDVPTLLGWHSSWRVLALVQGGMWPLAVWLFWDYGTPYHRLALLLCAYSYALASVQLLATQRIFGAFLLVVLLPTIVRVASDESHPYHWQLALVLSLLFGITYVMGRSYRGALDQAIHLKVRTDQLAAQLRVEKAAADEARRAAEAASRAKTQFFAAASHDLRQPLHAMGLFAETLRQRSHDPEVASLVNSINESVDALEGLFGELLDITRIDTGGVEVNPAPVRMKDLFARLRLHFEPTAFEKGLVLDFHGERHVAHTDSTLVERILRNLVSNAIRYSEDGGVLVSCRPRDDKLLLQVWDTGIGISARSLPRIFDEFYQVQSNRPLEPHQRKGLGLGLAIVKRLADLLGAPLDVKSVVGRGTVFAFEVPVGRETRSAEAAPATTTKMPLGLTLQGRRIAVVEDEVTVREGLVVLLQAWGASVEAFDTVAAVQAWVAHPTRTRPDLLIVDYRLPAGSTGLDALAVLRARWPEPVIPAIVVTGSSLGGHEDEATTHNFHLLIKPVLPNKLRAMIAFKLGVR